MPLKSSTLKNPLTSENHDKQEIDPGRQNTTGSALSCVSNSKQIIGLFEGSVRKKTYFIQQ